MRYRKSITSMLCLAGILTITLAVGGTILAQDLVDPNDLIAEFLPDGTTLLTATPTELAEAVEKAATEYPGRVAAIVRAASAARPDAVEEIVAAAVRLYPENLDEICLAAMDGAPEGALDIHVCQDVFETAVRLETMPVTKPARDEPSPIRPR